VQRGKVVDVLADVVADEAAGTAAWLPLEHAVNNPATANREIGHLIRSLNLRLVRPDKSVARLFDRRHAISEVLPNRPRTRKRGTGANIGDDLQEPRLTDGESSSTRRVIRSVSRHRFRQRPWSAVLGDPVGE
jgi:hypothetical protein